MVRLFVALELPTAVRTRLALVRAPLPDARWVPPENMHITLRFIGEVEPPQATEIDTVLGRIDAPTFEIRLGALGTFGSRERVRTLWAGVAASAELAHLQTKIETACQRAGLAPEGRKFHPHVTLARCKNAPKAASAEFIATHNGFDLPAIAVDKFALFSSRTGRTGAIYTAEAVYPLAP